CKIEHLLSDTTAERASRLLLFLGSEAPEARGFLEALDGFEPEGPEGEKPFPSAEIEALARRVAGTEPGEEKTKGRD
ncbi:MAG: hypothetical protein ACE5GW_11630, partial [Planctomycetota bacterium]